MSWLIRPEGPDWLELHLGRVMADDIKQDVLRRKRLRFVNGELAMDGRATSKHMARRLKAFLIAYVRRPGPISEDRRQDLLKTIRKL